MGLKNLEPSLSAGWVRFPSPPPDHYTMLAIDISVGAMINHNDLTALSVFPRDAVRVVYARLPRLGRTLDAASSEPWKARVVTQFLNATQDCPSLRRRLLVEASLERARESNSEWHSYLSAESSQRIASAALSNVTPCPLPNSARDSCSPSCHL